MAKPFFLANVLNHTDFDKYDITILNYRCSTISESIKNRIANLPVKIVTPGENGIIEGCKELIRLIRHCKYDVVHSHMWDQSGIFLFIAYIMNVPVRVAHSHNTSKVANRYGILKSVLRDKFIWPILKIFIYIFANRFVACSENAAKWLFTKRIIRNNKFTICINGINLKQFTSQGGTPEWGGENPVVNILFAGRLIEQKNPLFAIDVFNEIKKELPNARLTIIGNGPQKAEVSKKAEKYGLMPYICFVSETNDMVFYYQKSDLLLFPSLYEGLGIVLIEAQAVHLKCIASDTVPLEVQCGLVEFMSIDAGAAEWANKSIEMLNNLNPDIVLYEERISKYDIANTVNQLDCIYKQ